MNNKLNTLTMLYDAGCPVCALEMDHLRERNVEGRLGFIDISAPGFDPAPYGRTLAELNAEIHAVQSDGQQLIGLAALRAAYAAVGLGWVRGATAWWALAGAAGAGYRTFARRRQRISRAVAPLLHAARAWRVSRAARRCAAGACALGPHHAGDPASKQGA